MLRVILRKIYRIIMGSLFPLLYLFTERAIIPIIIAAVFLSLVLILEVARKKYPGLYPYITSRWYGKFLKKEEGRLLGTTYFLISTLIVISIFSKEAAICALLFNTFGDAFSALIGIKYGRIKFFGGKKSLEGTLAFFIVCFIIGILLTNRLYIPLSVILIGSIVAAIIEFLPIPINDNFTIPIGTAIFMDIFLLL